MDSLQKIKNKITETENRDLKSLSQLKDLWEFFQNDGSEPLEIQETISISNKLDGSTKQTLSLLEFITPEGIESHNPNTQQAIDALCKNFDKNV
jgi:hypothetical protein